MGAKQVMHRTHMCDPAVKTDHGINENHVISSEAYMIRIIYIIFFKMSSGSRSQVTSGRKTHDTYTHGIYSKFLSSGPNNQYRTLGILKRSGFFMDHSTVIRDTIFQNKCSNTGFIKPSRHI